MLLLALALCAPGCGSDEDAPGQGTVTVYVSVPLSGERAAEGRGIVRGARQALEEAGGRAGGLRIRAVFLDDTGGGKRWDMAATGRNARRAVEDASAVAYIGDLDSGATRISLPITNQAQMLQLSPGAGAPDLTRYVEADLEPDRYRPSDEQTFARLVPAEDVLARTAARVARRLGADAAAYTAAQGREPLRTAFADEARRLGVEVSGHGGIAFDVTYAPGVGPRFLEGIGQIRPAKPVILGPATEAELATACRSIEQRVVAVAGSTKPASAYGYEAMRLVVDAVRAAGADRAEIIDAVLGTRKRRSAIGAYSLSESGDIRAEIVDFDPCEPPARP